MKDIVVNAVFLGEHIDIRKIEAKAVAIHPLMVEIGKEAKAVVFKYGVVVFFNASKAEEEKFINKIKPLVTNPNKTGLSEKTLIHINEKKTGFIDEKGEIVLDKTPSIIRLQLIAIVLSENIVLSGFEQDIQGIFDRLEPIMISVKNNGMNDNIKEANLLKTIGGMLKTMLNMIARVGIIDNPDVLWDNPDEDRLFKSLKEEYEILERDKFLNKKFKLASDTVETLLDLTRHSHSARLDWYVISLIVISVTIMIYEFLN